MIITNQTLEEKRAACFNRFFDMKSLFTYPSLVCGDSTPSYLLHSNIVIPRIKEVAPWVKLFVCLRDPVLRAYSHYQMVVDKEGTPAQLATRGQSQWANKTFHQVVEEELGVLESLNITADTSYAEFASKYLDNPEVCPLGHGGHSLVARGLYALQLDPWMKEFPLSSASGSGSLMVVRLEDLTSKTNDVLAKAFSHIGIDEIEIEDTSAKNARSYQPLNEGGSSKDCDDSNAQAASRLRDFYLPHNKRLDELLGVDGFTANWTEKKC
jgi:hypothetical protein